MLPPRLPTVVAFLPSAPHTAHQPTDEKTSREDERAREARRLALWGRQGGQGGQDGQSRAGGGSVGCGSSALVSQSGSTYMLPLGDGRAPFSIDAWYWY